MKQMLNTRRETISANTMLTACDSGILDGQNGRPYPAGGLIGWVHAARAEGGPG